MFKLTPEQLITDLYGPPKAAGQKRLEDFKKKEIPKPERPRGSGELAEKAEEARADAEEKLNQRARQFNLPDNFRIDSPQGFPEYITPEHVKAINEVFGQVEDGLGGERDNLEMSFMPTLADIGNLEEGSPYVRMMYPETRNKEDKQNGLISYHSSWFKDPSDQNITKSQETWGRAYLRSMAEEMKKHQGAIILVESIRKPKYKDGSQHYGSTKGNDRNKDPLLPLFREAFGPEANRFNHSHDEITEKILPKAKAEIIKKMKAAGMEIGENDLEVIICPAPVFNLQSTLYHPENSATDTWEWANTILTDINGNDSGRRLNVGCSVSGGAAYVYDVPRGGRWGSRGVRLAVMLKKR